YEEAIEACKTAISLDPECGTAHNDLAAYLIEKGELDEAILHLQRALCARRYEAHHDSRYHLGRVYMRKGMLKRAIVELRKAIEIAPGHRPAQAMIARIERMLN
ncbi:MAG: tetratricopeptide repeat protein, partial [Deltaproteobacteria bacterium]